jgi:hypothetical protein
MELLEYRKAFSHEKPANVLIYCISKQVLVAIRRSSVAEAYMNLIAGKVIPWTLIKFATWQLQTYPCHAIRST